MPVRWGWRAVSSSSQSEISFANVNVAMVFLLFCVVVFEGFPPSPVLVSHHESTHVLSQVMETSFRSMTALGMQRDDGEHPRPGPRSLSRGLCDFPANLRKYSLCDVPHPNDSAGFRRPETLSCASEGGQRRENEVGCASLAERISGRG